jgi:hypothetical protein
MVCPVCNEDFTEHITYLPRILPCGHTFCQKCLLESFVPAIKSLECALCRMVHRNIRTVEGFTINYALLQSKDRNRKESRKRPNKNALSSPSFSSAVIDDLVGNVPVKEVEVEKSNFQSPMCQNHQKPFLYYDDNCSILVCKECCFLKNHRGK